MSDFLWFLAILVAAGAACFYCGWRSAYAYLEAARAVSRVTNVVAAQSNEFTSALDKSTSEAASLRQSVEQMGARVGGEIGDVEALLKILIAAFEGAGIVRRTQSSAAPGRQVGERPPDQ